MENEDLQLPDSFFLAPNSEEAFGYIQYLEAPQLKRDSMTFTKMFMDIEQVEQVAIIYQDEQQPKELSMGDSELKSTGDGMNSSSELKKSQFHNFQKHLVTTIRRASQLGKIKIDDSSALPCAMWKQFLKSKKYNKSLLYILFGEYNQQNEEQEDLFLKFDFYHFTEKHSQNKIQHAQQQLRLSVLSQMKAINWDDLLEKRRIKKKNEFINYMQQFLNQLSQGPLGKRISKEKTAVLEEQNNSYLNSSDTIMVKSHEYSEFQMDF